MGLLVLLLFGIALYYIIADIGVVAVGVVACVTTCAVVVSVVVAIVVVVGVIG